MASSANALLRPRAAQLPWHSLLLVVAGGTALAILVLAQRVEARLALYWALGLGVGLVLQRGRLCFAGAFRDLFLMRNGTMMRAIIVGLALMAPVFALIEARAVPEPSFGAVAAGAHVVPLGLNLAVGGLLFGIGMVVAGGCVSGTLYRIGEGYLASWASLFGILLGLSLAAHTWNAWYAWTIQSAPIGWLPTTLGYGGAVVLTWVALGAAYVASLWWEAREFKVRVPRQRRRYVQSFAGGSLMGYGAGIGIGCTIGAFFSAIPSLGLSGWVFGLALLVGAGIGTQIIRRIA